MSPIKNVAVTGAGGNLGPFIVKALLEHNFTVTALTRPNSKSTFNPAVRIEQTDYTSTSLNLALKGQDAVVCSLGWQAIQTQIAVIDAAVENGVQRFIPSEYGFSPEADLPPEFAQRMESKEKVGEYLHKKAKEISGFSWSSIATGPFIDLAILTRPLFGFDLKTYSATIYGSGNEPFTCTMLLSIGLTVAQTLLRAAETENRWIRVLSLKTSQNQILTELEKQTGKQWGITRVKIEDLKVQGQELMKAGDGQGYWMAVLKTQLFGDKDVHGSVHCDEWDRDNELLGVKVEGVDKVVSKWLTAFG